MFKTKPIVVRNFRLGLRDTLKHIVLENNIVHINHGRGRRFIGTTSWIRKNGFQKARFLFALLVCLYYWLFGRCDNNSKSIFSGPL